MVFIQKLKIVIKEPYIKIYIMIKNIWMNHILILLGIEILIIFKI